MGSSFRKGAGARFALIYSAARQQAAGEKNAVVIWRDIARGGKACTNMRMTGPTFIAVADAAAIAPDSVTTIAVAGRSILLVHHEGRLFAVENQCSHAQEPLACGRVKRGWIACPAHGARFDLETGEPLSPPASAPIATFAVRIERDRVELAI